VKDAEWIADLLCHGLLRSSFVPPKAIRELRDLTRYRRKLVESRSAERNRLLKLLETANIKLASVATDVFGVSGRLMLQALVQATTTPQEMAGLAKGLLRKKIPELELALEGKVEEHHRPDRMRCMRIPRRSRFVVSWTRYGSEPSGRCLCKPRS
jgi:transposase